MSRLSSCARRGFEGITICAGDPLPALRQPGAGSMRLDQAERPPPSNVDRHEAKGRLRRLQTYRSTAPFEKSAAPAHDWDAELQDVDGVRSRCPSRLCLNASRSRLACFATTTPRVGEKPPNRPDRPSRVDVTNTGGTHKALIGLLATPVALWTRAVSVECTERCEVAPTRRAVEVTSQAPH